MTGRELIIYILKNNLEDEQIISNEKLSGFMTVKEACVKYGYGIETMILWAKMNQAPLIKINDETYILGNPSEWS